MPRVRLVLALIGYVVLLSLRHIRRREYWFEYRTRDGVVSREQVSRHVFRSYDRRVGYPVHHLTHNKVVFWVDRF